MIKHKISLPLLLNLLAATSTFAANPANITISGTVTGLVPLYQSRQDINSPVKSLVANKPVSLLRITLSDQAKHQLAENVKSLSDEGIVKPSSLLLPAQVNLNMNGVPVLDQGQHGACVTFAATGALDAVHGHEDYISQLCNLELGSYLKQQDSNYDSGWDGSFGYIVMNQIKQYGIINMNYQQHSGCAGVTQYPLYSSKDEGKPMSTDEFAAHSENILKDMSYNILLHPNEAFTSKLKEGKILEQVKQSLVNNHRVIFGVLVDINHGGVGAFGKYKVKGDSWILTPAIKKDAENNKITAGHEIIIIGYDDHAVIKGPNNTKHKGVLTIRNSWGDYAGDQGNYYMSYDYFNLLTDEAIEILPTAAS